MLAGSEYQNGPPNGEPFIASQSACLEPGRLRCGAIGKPAPYIECVRHCRHAIDVAALDPTPDCGLDLLHPTSQYRAFPASPYGMRASTRRGGTLPARYGAIYSD